MNRIQHSVRHGTNNRANREIKKTKTEMRALLMVHSKYSRSDMARDHAKRRELDGSSFLFAIAHRPAIGARVYGVRKERVFTPPHLSEPLKRPGRRDKGVWKR